MIHDRTMRNFPQHATSRRWTRTQCPLPPKTRHVTRPSTPPPPPAQHAIGGCKNTSTRATGRQLRGGDGPSCLSSRMVRFSFGLTPVLRLTCNLQQEFNTDHQNSPALGEFSWWYHHHHHRVHLPPKTSHRGRFRRWWAFSVATTIHHPATVSTTLENEPSCSFPRVVGLLRRHHHPPPSKTSHRARFRGWWAFSVATTVHHRVHHPRKRAIVLVSEGGGPSTPRHHCPPPPPPCPPALENEPSCSFSRVVELLRRRHCPPPGPPCPPPSTPPSTTTEAAKRATTNTSTLPHPPALANKPSCSFSRAVDLLS
jgi:hypothetical protein